MKMRHFFNFWSLVFVAGLLTLHFSLPTAGYAAGEPLGYEQAKLGLAKLRSDEQRSKYRHEWIKSADSFYSIYTNNKDWNNRPAALFRSAEALEEMARRSFVRKDAQDAAARFELLARNHPQSVLADDSLYRAAVIRHELMRDAKDARVLLVSLGKKYPKGDYAAKAAQYLSSMSGGKSEGEKAISASSATASSGSSGSSSGGKTTTSGKGAAASGATPAKPQSPPATTGKTATAAPATQNTAKVSIPSSYSQVTRVLPQLRQDSVRINVYLDKPATWRIRYQAPDPKNDRPPRLVLELSDSGPAKSLKPGERLTSMGILSRYAVDYTAKNGKTVILLDFKDLYRYSVKAEKSPFRLIIDATTKPNAISASAGITVKSDPSKPAPAATKPAATATGARNNSNANIPIPQNIASQLNLRVGTIVIDPGHGGKDPGATHHGLVEREVCLDVSKRLAGVLRRAGYTVILTREKDTFLTPEERPVLAARKKADLFISIHVNANTKKEKSGIETYFLSTAASKDADNLARIENAGSTRLMGDIDDIMAELIMTARIQESRSLAESIQNQTLARLKKAGYNPHNGGARGALFLVLIGGKTPGALVEIGYSSNAEEAKLLKQAKYRDLIAEGIANGIHQYVERLKQGK